MVQENDKIKFESRREIESVMLALGDYLKRHKKDDDTTLQTAQELFDKLDYMHMVW